MKARARRRWCRCCQNAMLVSSGSNVGIVGMLCQCCQGAALVSLECGVGVVEAQRWCHRNMVSALLRHGVCVVRTQYWYCRDAVSVSSGCGISVIGTCRHHWEAVLVSVSSGDRRPCRGHLRMARLTAIFETSTRCDMICKSEEQGEGGELTNHKSTRMKWWLIGLIYCQLVGRLRASCHHTAT